MNIKHGIRVLRVLSMSLALATPARLWAVTLGSNENVGDGTLTGSDEAVKAQADGKSYLWADKNGNGTMTPATAGLNLNGFDLTRTLDSTGIFLDLHDGSTKGSLVNGGTIKTSRKDSTGGITVSNAAAIVAVGIVTKPLVGYKWAGAISLLDVGDIDVGDLHTSAGIATSGPRAITVVQSGFFRADSVRNDTTDVNGAPYLKSFRGGGKTAGSFQAGEILGAGYCAVQGTNIEGYRGVTIGTGGINAESKGGSTAPRHPGKITITQIGLDGITVHGDLSNASSKQAGNYDRPIEIDDVDGPVTLANVKTYTEASDWSQKHGGNVLVEAAGDIAIASVSTYYKANSDGYDGGNVTLTSSAGAVTLGNVDGRNHRNHSGSLAGNVTITAAGDIALTGAVDLSAVSGATARGVLTLTTTVFGKIRIGDEESDVCDLALLKTAALESATKTSWIAGSLVNFDTSDDGGSGTVADPLLTSQTVLRCADGQRIYYDSANAGNSYLGGLSYRVASLAGVAGAGGLLLPSSAAGSAGTVIMLR
jgi:hypothetical protein